MLCDNPFCRKTLTSENGVNLHIRANHIGFFCKECTVMMKAAVRKSAEVGATFLMSAAKMYISSRFPVMSNIIQKVFENPKV